VEPEFSRMNEVRVQKMNENIGVGAGVGRMNQIEFFVVEVYFLAVDKGGLRQRAGRRRWKAEVQHGNLLRRGQPQAYIFLPDNERTGQIQSSIAVGVVKQPARIQEQLEWMRCQ